MSRHLSDDGATNLPVTFLAGCQIAQLKFDRLILLVLSLSLPVRSDGLISFAIPTRQAFKPVVDRCDRTAKLKI